MKVTNTLGHSIPNYSGHARIGCLYDPARSIKDVAVEVRRQLANYYPTKDGYKFSVRMSHYNYIQVTIMRVPFKVVNPKHNPRLYKPYASEREPRYTPAGEELLKQVKAILEAYNYNDSDAMTDYFSVNFYSGVSYDTTIEKQESDDIAIKAFIPEPGSEGSRWVKVKRNR